jgi:hypothetical protein
MERDAPFEQSPHEREAVSFVRRADGTIQVKLGCRHAADVDWWLLLGQYALASRPIPESDYWRKIAAALSALEAAANSGGDSLRLLEMAVSLGSLITEARLHSELARPTQVGKQVIAGGKKGADVAHGAAKLDKYAQYCAMFEELIKSGKSKGDAVIAAAKHYGVSVGTIQNARAALNSKSSQLEI